MWPRCICSAPLTGGDESVPQGVRPDRLSDSRAAGDPADDPPCAVPVQPPPVRREEDRSLAALTDSRVDGPRGSRRERDGDGLAALTPHRPGPLAAPHAPFLDRA